MADYTKYRVEFRYTDNKQLYSNYLELTDAEHVRVAAFLTKLLDGKAILAGDETDPDTIEWVLWVYTKPEFENFDYVEKHWTGSCTSIGLMADTLALKL